MVAALAAVSGVAAAQCEPSASQQQAASDLPGDSAPAACQPLPPVADDPASDGTGPSAGWTPGPAERSDLSLLADTAGLPLPILHWPLPGRTVGAALDRLPEHLPTAQDHARARVRAALARDLGASAGLTLATPAERPAGFGDDATPGSAAWARSGEWRGGRVSARLGARLERGPTTSAARASGRLEGSHLATTLGPVQLQAWSQRLWWGPGWQDSLILGHNAPSLNGIGLQRASALPSRSPWLAWLGPWTFEVFVAGLEGVRDPAQPTLFGARLGLRPADWLEIGLVRTAQWAGRGRPSSAGSFVRMLAGSQLNFSDEEQRDRDAANGMAGLDLRMRCPAGWPCAVYGQWIGEDEAGRLPSSFLGLLGVEGWTGDGRHRWFAELAESGCGMPVGRDGDKPCAYRNHAYPEGYVHDGRWLGASAGPDSRIGTLGWIDVESRTSLRLRAGTLGAGLGHFVRRSEEPRRAGRLVGLSLARTWTWRGAEFTPDVAWTRVRTAAGGHDRHLRVGFSLVRRFGAR